MYIPQQLCIEKLFLGELKAIFQAHYVSHTLTKYEYFSEADNTVHIHKYLLTKYICEGIRTDRQQVEKIDSRCAAVVILVVV